MLRRVQTKLLELLTDSRGSTRVVASSESVDGSVRSLRSGHVTACIPGERRWLLCEASKRLALLLLQRKHDGPAAVAVCEEAVRRNAVDGDLQALRCRLSLQLGNVEEAERILKELQATDPQSTAGYPHPPSPIHASQPLV